MNENPVEKVTRDLIESYKTEARLLEEVVDYTARSEKLATERDFAALCDCLLGRGERMEAIAQLEAERKKLEKELGGRIHEGVKKAREQALLGHGKAIRANNRIRGMLVEYKDILEEELTALRHGKITARAYDGPGDSGFTAMFLDQEG